MQFVVRGVRRPVQLEAPNRVLVVQDSTDHRNAKVFRAHAAPQGMCDNLIIALKLLGHQQTDDDSLVRMIVPGLLEQSWRTIIDWIRLLRPLGSQD